MSKDDDTPSSGGGLLSKVVRFVRNPTVNWSELDSIQEDKESQYSKQMLKEMIERKRRNDFVRRREFDQLRKLRQRDALSGQRTADPAARPSFFQSSLTSPGERAVTIKKIDEIEAQMSMQWWKGKQGADAAETLPPPDVPTQVQTAPAAPDAYAPTAPLPLGAALPGTQGAPEPLFSGESLSAPDGPGMLPPEEPGGAPWSLGAAPVAQAAPAMERFVHEPDLEEAAIRFANGDYAGAEAGLLEVLERHSADDPDAQFEIWMTLFDLYRATGQQDRFDALAIDFAARFSRSAPLWFSLPEQLGLQATVQEEPAVPRREFSWNAPAAVTLQSVAALQASINRSASPWTLTWTRLKSIEDAALTALANEFSRWADLPGQFVFAGAQALQALLQEHTQSGVRESNPEWWRLRMALLRLMGQPDEFEMVALDYCVTYEVSPPSWATPRCGYSSDAAGEPPPSAPAPVQDLVARPPWNDSATLSTLTGFGDSVPAMAGLSGHIEGDAAHLLEGVQDQVPAGQPLAIACDKLIRIDFTAAGSVLNWAAHQQAQGREVQFHNLHRLVAVLFNVLGVNEHAWVLPRKN
ncbi:MAG: STAS domain-containing protein [Burkholderiales bacterium]|nr:STAS domain-containing protein [Burkholderiales bacterium]